MTLNEYQKASRKVAMYPSIGSKLVYPTLGLAGEAGEIANKVKKIFRDNDGVLTDDRKKELQKELGDVLWYLNQVATELGADMEDIAQHNLDKLFSRKDRGVIKGDGDNR